MQKHLELSMIECLRNCDINSFVVAVVLVCCYIVFCVLPVVPADVECNGKA
jgi:hypothetical protein